MKKAQSTLGLKVCVCLGSHTGDFHYCHQCFTVLMLSDVN